MAGKGCSQQLSPPEIWPSLPRLSSPCHSHTRILSLSHTHTWHYHFHCFSRCFSPLAHSHPNSTSSHTVTSRPCSATHTSQSHRHTLLSLPPADISGYSFPSISYQNTKVQSHTACAGSLANWTTYIWPLWSVAWLSFSQAHSCFSCKLTVRLLKISRPWQLFCTQVSKNVWIWGGTYNSIKHSHYRLCIYYKNRSGPERCSYTVCV